MEGAKRHWPPWRLHKTPTNVNQGLPSRGCCMMATARKLGVPSRSRLPDLHEGTLVSLPRTPQGSRFGLSTRLAEPAAHHCASHFAARDLFPTSWQDSKQWALVPMRIGSPAGWEGRVAPSNYNHGRARGRPTSHRHWTREPASRACTWPWRGSGASL